MAEQKIFVGREAEIEQFKKVLEDPKGQAILVVGHRGMGKTYLINKMAEIAEKYPKKKLKCGWVRYEVTPTDSVDSTMALMMDNAFEAASTKPGSFDKVPEIKRQWLALLKTVVPKGEQLAELILSLRRDPAKHTRDQFLERLRLVSDRMPENGRAIFIIDPEKYMQKESDQSWAIVVKELPEKIKFVFAQRPEDVLVGSEAIERLDNIISIPKENLDVLEEEAVDDLLNQRIGNLEYSVTEVRKVLSKYEGYPYALGAVLDLLEAGTKLEELPEKPEPTKFAEVQWKEVSNRSEDAIRLFKGYAILEVGVPDDVVEAVSELDSDKRQHLVVDKYLRGLLREEGEGKRIYHAILADYILGQIGEAEKKGYHARAVTAYRSKLPNQIKKPGRQEALAAQRLPEHILYAEGTRQFVQSFLEDSCQILIRLGLLDQGISLCRRAISLAQRKSQDEADLLIILAHMYDSRGQLEEAAEALLEAIEIMQQTGNMRALAIAHGNLGVVYQKKGDVQNAEHAHKEALMINKRINRKEGIVADYTNLSILYAGRGEIDKAKAMLAKAQETSSRVDSQVIAATYVQFGLLWKKKGGDGLNRAEYMFRQALDISDRLNDIEIRAASSFNLATVLCLLGNLEEGEHMLEQALKDYQVIGNQCMGAQALYLLGTIKHGKEELKKAAEML